MESDQDTGQVADSERGELIERMVLDIMHRQHLTKLGDIAVNLQKLDRFLTTEEIHDAARRLERRGEINLSEDRTGSSFLRNLADVEANAPFWIAIVACSVIAIATFVIPQAEYGQAVRRISSAAFLFVIPGYAMTNAFIARNRLSYVERMAVSVGLSLAIVAIIGIILAYGSTGITLEVVMGTLTAVIVALAIVAAYRDFVRRKDVRLAHQGFLGHHSGGM